MKRSYLWAVWLWAMQAVTGALLVVYVIVHTIDNGTILISPEAYEAMLKIWHEWLPKSLYYIMVAGLVVIFLLHMLNGIRIASKPYKEIDVSIRHAWMLKHPGTLFWLTQVLTGSVIAIFAVWHFIVQHTGEPTTTALQSAQRLTPMVFIIYVILIAAVMFHSFNGVRSILLKLGLMTDKAKEGLLVGLVGLFFLVFFVVGVASMGVFMSTDEKELAKESPQQGKTSVAPIQDSAELQSIEESDAPIFKSLGEHNSSKMIGIPREKNSSPGEN